MRMPFQNELEDAFAHDRSILLKVSGAAFASGVLTFAAIRRGRVNAVNSTGEIIAVAVAAAIGGCVGLALSMKDVVRSRLDTGKSVNPILRLFFGMGVLSLFIWIVLAFGLAIGFAFLDSMTVTKKHRPASIGSFNSVAVTEDFGPANRLSKTAP